MQFRVGLFVIMAVIATAVMVFQFGQVGEFFHPQYPLLIHFDSAPGVYPGTPVRRNGVAIGKVDDVVFDKYEGGVMVIARINNDVKLRQDAEPGLTQSLLGDASIEFTPGKSPRFLEAGAKIKGKTPKDPMQIVEELEKNVSLALVTLNATGEEWNKLAQNINGLVETNRGNLNQVIERSVISLAEFTDTMNAAQKTFGHAEGVLGNPQAQANMRKTLDTLPQMIEETRQVIQTVRLAVVKADENLASLNGVTAPLAERSTSIITRLDSTVANLDAMSSQLRTFVELAVKEDGSIQQFATNPELYQNLNNSAASLSLLLNNLEPVLRDVRIFSDKIARHPEIIGVSGALNPSSGVKEPEVTYPEAQRPTTRFSRN
jgi:phospholipid/cholesterol/gamma-HCH transport system substrate-binding protein